MNWGKALSDVLVTLETWKTREDIPNNRRSTKTIAK